MEDIVLPSSEEIVEINKRLGGKILKQGSLEFLITKVESRRLNQTKGNFRKNLSCIAAIFWHDTISLHPFLDGNKRTATETVQLLLYKNGFVLETTTAGMVYLSLKVANGDIDRTELVKWIYNNLKERAL
jgi:death-on-curing family protein